LSIAEIASDPVSQYFMPMLANGISDHVVHWQFNFKLLRLINYVTSNIILWYLYPLLRALLHAFIRWGEAGIA
jgi:hypothetical protein